MSHASRYTKERNTEVINLFAPVEISKLVNEEILARRLTEHERLHDKMISCEEEFKHEEACLQELEYEEQKLDIELEKYQKMSPRAIGDFKTCYSRRRCLVDRERMRSCIDSYS